MLNHLLEITQLWSYGRIWIQTQTDSQASLVPESLLLTTVLGHHLGTHMPLLMFV